MSTVMHLVFPKGRGISSLFERLPVSQLVFLHSVIPRRIIIRFEHTSIHPAEDYKFHTQITQYYLIRGTEIALIIRLR
jgi:hypothetical protein